MNNDAYLFSMYNIHNRKKRGNITREQKKELEPSEKLRRYLKNIIKYKQNIIEVTKEYLENPTKDISTSSNHLFFHYSQACIEYFENMTEPIVEEESDDDFLFDPYTELSTPESLLHNCFTPLKICNREPLLVTKVTDV